MGRPMSPLFLMMCSLLAVLALSAPVNTAPHKVKVFVLCGQSNMQGHGQVDKYNDTTIAYFNG